MAGISHVSILLYRSCKPITVHTREEHGACSLLLRNSGESCCAPRWPCEMCTPHCGDMRQHHLPAAPLSSPDLHSHTNSSEQECAKGLTSHRHSSRKHHWNHQTLWSAELQFILQGPQNCLTPDKFLTFWPKDPLSRGHSSSCMILGHCYPYMCQDSGYPGQDTSDNFNSSNGKLVHKPMLENNREVAQRLKVGTQALDQLQRCKSCFRGANRVA